MDIVLKLRELRRLSGLSQEDVAEKAGVGVKTLSSFESGARVQSMKLLQLVQILQVYGVTPAEFFGGKVEEAIFGELERLNTQELSLVRELRLLGESSRTRLEEKFLTMIGAAQVLAEPAPLHAAV
jgi:transcriptional regulator with XRE-family HTH domain